MKSFLGKIALSCVAVFLVVGGLEIAARLLGIGYPSGFLVREKTLAGKLAYLDNRHFGRRFFPQQISREAEPLRYEVPGGDNLIRVVVLGESAAMGEPQPEIGPPRMLEWILQQSLPGHRIEVVNAAMTAVNSHVIREIAADILPLKPDVVILYMGNNEVVGPFGPGTVFGSFSSFPFLQRMRVVVTRLRLAQGLQHLMTDGDAVPGEWRGLAMFTDRLVFPDSPGLSDCLEQFRQNLDAILRVVSEDGAKVVLNTVAVNRRRFAPFASGTPTADDPNSGAWNSLMRSGLDAFDAGLFEEARVALENADLLSPGSALCAYRLAQCHDALGQREQAEIFYGWALERDPLRFRADSSINSLIREAAARLPAAAFVDASGIFQELEWRDAQPNLFVDHVHFTGHGSWELARLWAGEIIRLLHLTPPANEPTLEKCRQGLFVTPWKEVLLADDMLGRFNQAPFKNRLDSDLEIEAWRLYARQAVREAEAVPDAMWTTAARRIALSPEASESARRNAVELLLMKDDYEGAWDGGRALLRKYPHRYDIRALMALAAAHSGNPGAGMDLLRDVPRGSPLFARVYLQQVAGLLLRSDRPSDALRFAQAARDLGLRTPEQDILMAACHARLDEAAQAEAILTQALARWPDHSGLAEEMALFLLSRQRTAEADSVLGQLAARNPDNPDILLKISAAKILVGRFDEAETILQNILRAHPGYSPACSQMGLLFERQDRADAARAWFIKALECDATDGQARRALRRMKREEHKPEPMNGQGERD